MYYVFPLRFLGSMVIRVYLGELRELFLTLILIKDTRRVETALLPLLDVIVLPNRYQGQLHELLCSLLFDLVQ